MRAFQSNVQGAAGGETGPAPAAPGKSTLSQAIPAPAAAEAEAARAGEGSVGEDQMLAGDDAPAPAPAEGAGPEGRGAPPPAAMTMSAVTINVTQAPIALSQRGSAEYKVRWSVGGGKNGWVIQHVKFQGAIQNSAGAAVAARNSGLEYWEGWQVRNGAVFVGSSGSAHQADTFRTISEDAKTKGQVSIIGKVAFVENYNLTEPPWGHTVAAAGALPTMTSAPDGWSDGSAQDHTLRVNYDDVAGTPQTQVGNP